MSNFGGKNSNFEKDFHLRFRGLQKSLIRVENNLQLILLDMMTTPKRTARYWQGVYTSINKEYATLTKKFDVWARKEIPGRYRRSLRQMQQRINNIKQITNTPNKTYLELLRSTAVRQNQQALYRDALNSWASAISAGRGNVVRLTRATQQAVLTEGLIDFTIGEGLARGDLRKGIQALTGQLTDPLLNMVKNKQFVQAGRYKYKASYYAELVGRTKFHDAHSVAALTQANNFNTDLVQVSSHNTTTKICQPFEAKIFSVSGRDKRFPALTETPPFHPNCLHLIFPTFLSGLEASNELNQFSAFSLGKANRPPSPQGFIPIDDREEGV